MFGRTGAHQPRTVSRIIFGQAVRQRLARIGADRDGIAAQMDEIDSLRLNMELARTKIGVRRNVIEVRADILEEQKVSLTGLLSENKDLDYTQAITELSSRMLALEAAQTTMSKISQLVLFNYLR